jgi:hypothetical protein
MMLSLPLALCGEGLRVATLFCEPYFSIASQITRPIDDVVTEALFLSPPLDLVTVRWEVRVTGIKFRNNIQLLSHRRLFHFRERKHAFGCEIVVACEVNHYRPGCLLRHSLTSIGSGTAVLQYLGSDC